MVPIKTRLDPDDHYAGANKVEYIVIHDTGNTTDSDEANANYFVTGTRNASAHYFVDDDSITQVVKDSDGAFHCGDGHGQYGITNRNSLGIEMCRVNGTVTSKTEANTIEIVKAKMKQYNVPLSKVVRHYDASRKNCPSSFSANNWARWNAFKVKLSINTIKPIIEEEFDMKKIVVYLGDADLFAAVIVSQKNACPLMRKADYDRSGLKVKTVIQVGGKPGSTRFTTFKDAASLV